MSYSHGKDDVEFPVLFPGGKVCKWGRQILHVALSTCQNLSLIVRGHCLHKADAVSKDVCCLVYERKIETEGEKTGPEIKHYIFHVEQLSQ